MQSVSPKIKPSPVRPRFGAGASTAVSLTSRVVGTSAAVADKVLGPLNRSRTTGLLVEDFIGFGLLRTWMDWHRGKMYGDEQNNQLAATERMARETASIFTDNILPGLIALGMGRLWANRQGFSNQFIGQDTVALFQAAAENAKHPEQFIQALVKALPGDQHADDNLAEVLETHLKAAWESGAKSSGTSYGQKLLIGMGFQEDPGRKEQLDAAEKMIRSLSGGQLKSFEREIQVQGKRVPMRLDNLLDDVSRFSRFMNQSAKKGEWNQHARQAIEKTLKAPKVRIPVAMLTAMAATFAIPFLLSEATRKITGINYYPGEIGLRKDEATFPVNQANASPGFFERHFAYLTESMKNGNPLPLIGSLLPLPAALGLFNTEKMSVGAHPKKWFVTSLKQAGRLLDFQKGFPHTTQQQMAALFALLISSRLMNARSDNEYRERLVDSAAGWGLWILGTPLIKRAAATFSDSKLGTSLLSQGSLRSRDDIERLLQGAVKDRTLKAHSLLGAGSTIATMLLLGIVEPWIGIKWTQHNEKQKQAKLAASQAGKLANGFNGFNGFNALPQFSANRQPAHFYRPPAQMAPQAVPYSIPMAPANAMYTNPFNTNPNR